MNTNQKIQDVELEIISSRNNVEAVISSTIGRGDRLEDILEAAENMREESSMFEKATKKVKRSMWWKKAKPLVIIGIIVVVVIAIAVIIVAI